LLTALFVQQLLQRTASVDGPVQVFDEIQMERFVGQDKRVPKSAHGRIDVGQRFLQCAGVLPRQVFEVAGAFPINV